MLKKEKGKKKTANFGDKAGDRKMKSKKQNTKLSNT